MKKSQVVIGNTYTAKVSGGIAPVRITEEKWAGDKHSGWAGVNIQTGRAVRIKSAQRRRARLRGQGGGGAAEAPAGGGSARDAAAGCVAGDVGPCGAGGEGAVLARAGSPVPPKAADGAKAGVGNRAKGGKGPAKAKPEAPKGKATAKVAKGAKTPSAKPKPERPLSGLDAAAKVLKDADAPMRMGEVLEIIQKKGLWMSKGKTPVATLYAAVIREIRDKGVGSRFVKKDRGLFASA